MSRRAAIYVRVSSERQAQGDRVSIEVQLEDCEAHCKRQGYVVVDRYVDKKKYRVRGKLVRPSGERKDRPAYRRMLRDARDGNVDVIVAWKEDRLYRGMYAAMPLSELLDEMGNKLDVELVKETFDRRMLGIKAALGKIEIDNIRERMLMGRRARLERGEVPGGDQVRYGYRKEDKRLVINEEEAAIVRQIFEWYISGANNLEIRRRLNEMDVSPRRGEKWAKSTIIRILASEYYSSGEMSTTLDGDTFILRCPPIITTGTWRKAQAVRQQNKCPVRNIKEDYLCVGLVHCGCGWKCHAKARRANANRGYYKVTGRYVCPRRQNTPEELPENCAAATSSKKVDVYVWNFVKRVCSNPEVLRDAVDRKLSALREKQADLEAELQRVETKIDGLATERQWVITQARKGRITEDDMEMQLAALQFQELGYRKELEECQAATVVRQQAAALSEWVDQYLTEIDAGIQALEVKVETLNDAERSALADELEASRYTEKFPDDELARLRWAILEEKRRVVRTLVEKVVVSRLPDRKREITPVLAFQIPVSTETRSEYRNSGDWWRK